MAADDLNGGAVSGSSGLSGAVYVPTGFTTSALENAVAAGGTAQDYAAIGTALSSAGSAVAIAAAAVAGAVTAGTLTGSITTASDRTGSDTLTQAETIWGVNVAEASEAYETAAAAAAEEAASKAASLAESMTTWQVAGSGDSRVLLRYTTVADYGSTDGSVDAVSSAQDTSGYSRDGTSGTAAASAASEQSSSAAAGTDAAGSAAASGTGSSTGSGSGSGSGTGGSAGSGSGASGSAGSGSGSSAGGRSGSAAYYDPLNGVKYTVVYASHPAAALQSGEAQSAAGLAAGSSPFAGDYAHVTEMEQTLWGGQTGTLRALDTSGDTVLWGDSSGAEAAAAEPAGLLARVVSLLTGGEDSGDSAALTEVLSAEYFSAGAAENTGASGVPENPVSAAPEFSDAPAGPAGAAEISGDLPGAETGAAGEFSDAALPDQPEVSGAAAFSGSAAAAGAGGAVSGLPKAYSGDLENSSAGGAPARGGLPAGLEFPPAALSGSAAELSEFSADPENPAFSESVSAGLSGAAGAAEADLKFSGPAAGSAEFFGSAAERGMAAGIRPDALAGAEISGPAELEAGSGFSGSGGADFALSGDLPGLSGVLFDDPEASGFSGLPAADSDTGILPAAEAERLLRMAAGTGGQDREARASGERSRKTLRIRSSGSTDDAGTGRILSALAQSFETRLAVSGEGVHR